MFNIVMNMYFVGCRCGIHS